jgi:hypothetical protein
MFCDLYGAALKPHEEIADRVETDDDGGVPGFDAPELT